MYTNRIVLIILSIFVLGYGWERDTIGIPIIIIQNRFDNMWSDTLRDTCICYNKFNGKEWNVIKRKNSYTLPYPQFLIFKEE